MKASLYTFDLIFSIADDLLVLIVLKKGVNSSMVISAVSIWALLTIKGSTIGGLVLTRLSGFCRYWLASLAPISEKNLLIYVGNLSLVIITLFSVSSNVFIVLSLLFGNNSFILDQNFLGLLLILLLFYRIYTIL